MYINPSLLIYLSPKHFFFDNHKFVFETCVSISVLCKFIYIILND